MVDFQFLRFHQAFARRKNITEKNAQAIGIRALLAKPLQKFDLLHLMRDILEQRKR
ncbi:MAG: hypothetical protein ACOY4H_04950 [Thermodesulfobacteriota bacterium]